MSIEALMRLNSIIDVTSPSNAERVTELVTLANSLDPEAILALSRLGTLVDLSNPSDPETKHTVEHLLDLSHKLIESSSALVTTEPPKTFRQQITYYADGSYTLPAKTVLIGGLFDGLNHAHLSLIRRGREVADRHKASLIAVLASDISCLFYKSDQPTYKIDVREAMLRALRDIDDVLVSKAEGSYMKPVLSECYPSYPKFVTYVTYTPLSASNICDIGTAENLGIPIVTVNPPEQYCNLRDALKL